MTNINRLIMTKEYNEWYWKTYRWFKWDAKHLHRDIAQGFKNLYKWFPIVWKDRDWDDHFIFEALKFKLKNTANYFEKRQRFVGWEDEVKYIRICEKLIKRIQDDYYQMEYMDYVNMEFDLIPIANTDKFEYKSTVTEDNLDKYFALYPRTKNEVLSSDKYKTYLSTDSGTALAMGVERHLKARKLLFKIMEKRIEAWWD
jgi:hypothetical protein